MTTAIFRMLSILCALWTLVPICMVATTSSSSVREGLSKQDEIPFAETRFIMTHDSFHVRPRMWIPQIFSGYPQGITAQLNGGIRGLEFDLTKPTPSKDDYYVMNIPAVDPESSCGTFRSCMHEVIAWSRSHERHYPIIILIDPDLDEAHVVANSCEDWIALSDVIRSIFSAPQDSHRLFTYAEFRTDYPDRTSRLGHVPIGYLRGKIMFVLDTGENNVSQLVHSNVLDAFSLSFWNFCDHPSKAIRDDPELLATYHWCHFLKFWVTPSSSRSRGFAKFGWLMRVLADYRLIQIPNHVIDGSTVSIAGSPPISVESWFADSLFNMLDSNRDGYVNWQDSVVSNLLDEFGATSLWVQIALHVGLPSSFPLWLIVHHLESVRDELTFPTNISAALARRDDVLSQCGQLVTTDFPRSLFGNFPYSSPVPPNGEFFLSPCASRTSIRSFIPTVIQYNNLWLEGSSLEDYGSVPRPASRGLMFWFWVSYSLGWITFLLSMTLLPFLCVFSVAKSCGWIFQNRRLRQCFLVEFQNPPQVAFSP